jgi:hypothetical protein
VNAMVHDNLIERIIEHLYHLELTHSEYLQAFIARLMETIERYIENAIEIED